MADESRLGASKLLLRAVHVPAASYDRAPVKEAVSRSTHVSITRC